MRILLLCNVILPQIALDAFGNKGNDGAGWIVGILNNYKSIDDIDVKVCFPTKKTKTPVCGSVDGYSYYGFPQTYSDPTKYNSKTEPYFEKLIKGYKPDIIHIFGTEFPHTLAMVNVCKNFNCVEKIVINIQGLCSVIAKHYVLNIPSKVVNSWTLRDIIKHKNIKYRMKEYQKRGIFEIEAIQGVKHVIGRTEWDKACTTQINPEINYHFCNEILRDSFYKGIWDITKCERYSIFVSQMKSPIKGFHQVLEAMPEVLKRFPNAHLYVTGKDLFNIKFVSEKIKITSYQKYIVKLIKKYKLENKVTFLGSLSEVEMCNRFLKSHVLVSASSIENSPNSVGEAMLLGVPTISSDVGGVKNMLNHNKEGIIYQHDAPYMLAHSICRIFGDDELALEFSHNARIHAQQTHNVSVNISTMIDIYKQIMEENL